MTMFITILVYFVVAFFLVTKCVGYMKKAVGKDELTGRQEIFAYLAAFGLFNVATFVTQVLMAGLLFLL